MRVRTACTILGSLTAFYLQAAYCDPGLISEVVRLACSACSTTCTDASALCADSSLTFDVAVLFALYIDTFRERQPLRAPQRLEHRVGWANAPVAWQSKMFELRDPTTGRQLFETISISLVCDDCMKTGSH